MSSKIKEQTWAIIILLLCFIYLFLLSYFSKGLYGDADSIAHYNLARFAFKYPYHFIHHWGKPLYTTLCAPFAQLGYQGAMTFNILCGLLTAWLIYRITKELKFRNALMVIPFALFAPIYMVTMMTGLTEILFGLVLVAGIYFFLKEKSLISAVIISFIPYARTEGLIFLFIFLLAIIVKRKFKAIPFLLTGFVIYSIAGYSYYQDIFWFFTKIPYGEEGSKLYGSGSFFYYLGKLDITMGWPLLFLAVLGLLGFFVQLFKADRPSFNYSWITKYYLITGSFFAFIFIHSFLWWRGMMAVLASDRFMACIMPLGAVFALAGLNYLFALIKPKAWIKTSLILIILALVIYMPYQSYEVPAKIDGQEQVMKETAAALKDMGYQDKRTLFFDPKLPFYLEEDPYDLDRMRFRTSDPLKPEVNQPDSTFLVWDTYFAAVEKKISLEGMLSNKNFRLIDGFYPGKDFNFHTGMNYMSLIFQKVPEKEIQNAWIQFDSLDFESAIKESHQKALSDSISYTGSMSNLLDSGSPFSISAIHKLDDIPGPDKIIFRGRVKVFFPEILNMDKAMLVLEVRDPAEKMFRYVVIAATYFKPEPGKWFEMSMLIPFRKDIPDGGYMKFYFWNTSNKKVFIDDMVLEYLPVNR